jgi:hypothetical protein
MKTFIEALEEKLLTSSATFEEFDKGLWFYLCSRTKTELKKLTKELGAEGKYFCDTNIGNIRIEVINYLKIDFIL